MFDFSQPEDSEFSIVGFTCNVNHGITHAHSFTNRSLMNDEEDGFYDFNLVPFVESKSNKTIAAILKERNIPLEMFAQTSSNFSSVIEWNCQSVLNFFDDIIGKSNYRLLFSQDNRIIIRTNSYDEIQCLFKKTDEVRDVFLFNNILLFFDFNKSCTDSDNFYMAAIQHNDAKCKESCDYVVDSTFTIVRRKTFDHILLEYGAPYDIIKRRNSANDKLEDALMKYDAELVNIYLSDETFKSQLKNNQTDIGHVFTESIFSHYSLSLINAIYDNGLTLTKLFHKSTLVSVYLKTFDVLYRLCKKYRFLDVTSLTDVMILNQTDEKVITVSLDLLKRMMQLETEEPLLDVFQMCNSYGFNSAFIEAMRKFVSEATNRELAFETSNGSNRPRFTA